MNLLVDGMGAGMPSDHPRTTGRHDCQMSTSSLDDDPPEHEFSLGSPDPPATMSECS